MAKNDPKNAQAEDVEIPAHLKVADFDSLKGESFGGSSDILALEVGEAVGPITYLGSREVDLGTGKPTLSHEGRDAQGHNWRLPIAANFSRQIETGNVQKGDIIAIKRIEDAVKKKGVGAGQTMQMFMIKVLTRAAE